MSDGSPGSQNGRRAGGGGRHSVRANTFAVGAGQLSAWVLTIPTFLLNARYLGPEGLGQFAIATTFAAIAVSLASLGMAVLVTRELARDDSRGAAVLSNALWVSLGASVVTGAITAAIGYVSFDSELLTLILIGELLIPAQLINRICRGALQGVEQMRYQASIDIVQGALLLGSIIVVAILDAGIVWLMITQVITVYLASIAFLLNVSRTLHIPLRPPSPATIRALIARSAPLWASDLVSTFQVSLGIVALSQLASPTAVGEFRAPNRLTASLLFVPTMITTVAFPRLSATYHAAPAVWRKIAPLTAHATIASVSVIAVLSIGIGLQLLLFVVGDEFRKSEPVFVMLALTLIPMSANMALSRILVSADRERRWSAIFVGQLPLRIVAFVACIPLFDLWFDNPALGAATARLVTESAIMLAAALALPRDAFGRPELSRFARLAVAMTVALTVMYLVQLGTSTIALAGTAGALTYLGAVAALRVHTWDELREGARWALERRAARTAPVTSKPGVGAT